MSEPERRALHARLAEVIDDPEEQVRHRALTDAGPDEATAAALNEAARRTWLIAGPADADVTSQRSPQLNHLLPQHTPSSMTRTVFECIVEDLNAPRR